MMTLNVVDMTCGHCVKTITRAIHGVAPNALVSCDVQSTLVKIDGEYVEKDVQAAIAEAGFNPQMVDLKNKMN